MDNIKHFILTRFNIASPGREMKIRLQPEWLEKRFKLFEELCLPSVKSQTCQDFEWIVFFDEKTPVEYHQKIYQLQSLFPFRAEFTGMCEMNRVCPQFVASIGKGEGDWLLTTRLDSDDMIAIEFVGRLRSLLTQRRRQIVNFTNGTILSLNSGKPTLYIHRDNSNPFVSLLEPFNNKICTIWGEQHVNLDRLAPITQVGDFPAWMQVVHGDNVSNRIKGVRVPIRKHAVQFPYLTNIVLTKLETSVEITMENFTLVPLRSIREGVRSLAKRVIN